MARQRTIALMKSQNPGRAPEIIEAMREQKRWSEQRGPEHVWAGRIMHAGPAAATLAILFESEDAQSAGKATDTWHEAQAGGEAGPLFAIFAGDNPAAELTGLISQRDITPAPSTVETPSPRASAVIAMRANPGRMEDAMQVFGASQQYMEGLGGHLEIWLS